MCSTATRRRSTTFRSRSSEGAIVAIVGANGAGKTSLIRTIAGMHRPARGRIRSAAPTSPAGQAIASAISASARWRKAGRCFPTLSVAENLEMGAMLPRARAGTAKKSRPGLCAVSGPGRTPGQAAGTLSGGEQQMLAIGRCLMGAPELIMFDEPSLGLAPAVVQNVLRTIRDLNREGLTCVLVEQNVAVSLKLASARLRARERPHHASGKGEELLADDRVRQAYLGCERLPGHESVVISPAARS